MYIMRHKGVRVAECRACARHRTHLLGLAKLSLEGWAIAAIPKQTDDHCPASSFIAESQNSVLG
jgi:hypothetical protein